VGPTGSGKSALGLELALAVSGEIVNCDSVQVYQGFAIGSAKTPEVERRGIPHHVIDIIPPEEELSAGAYSQLSRDAIRMIQSRGRVPIIVGGTGLYLRALIDGLSPAPVRSKELRSRLEVMNERNPATLHRYLRRFDREAAHRIHPNDLQKLIRAVELIHLARQPTTVTQRVPRQPLSGSRVLKIGLTPERGRLYERINDRTRWMFTHGLIEETRSLLEAGVSPESKPMLSIGYKQAIAVLLRGILLEEAIRDCQTRTRNYAKRQMTWFRSEPGIHWITGFGFEREAQDKAIELAKQFISTT
jgi:tRNA dimethylallyltransferase